MRLGHCSEIGQSAVLDLAFLAEGFAQKNARWRITVRDRFDIHGDKYAIQMSAYKDINANLHGYIFEPNIAYIKY